MKSGPTIKDIARAVGVTPATVSYVLNQNPKQSISAQTRERVMKAAQEMGYVPSSAAKVVRGSPSYCVGVAIEKDLNTNRFDLVLQGIRDKMEQQGYNLMLCGFERRHGIYADYVNNALERRVDGVIFIGRDNEGPTPEAEELILRHQIPFVVYDCGLEGRPYSTVELEYEKSSFEMTCRLLAEGAKTIFYIRPDLDNYQETQREAGVHRAMSLYKNSRLIVERAPITKETMYHPDSNPNQSEDLYTARRLWPYVSQRVMPVLEDFTERDAVLLSWGMFINPVWELLNKVGRRVRLATLSNVFVSPILRDEVVSCRFLGYAAGAECARLLLKQLDGDRTPEQVLVPMPVGRE